MSPEVNELAFFNSRRYKLTLCLSMSIFFYAFLVFFLPFGVSNYDPLHEYTTEFLLEILNFFLVSILVLFFNEFILKDLIPGQLSIRTVIIWSVWTLFLLGVANFLTYNILGDWHDMSAVSAVSFIGNCASVFTFPMLGVFFYFRYRALQFTMTQLKDRQDPMNFRDVLITFTGEGSKDQITIAASSFLYAKAQDNYVAICYLENERLTKTLIRSSLGSLYDSLEFRSIVRCHRSYLVNLIQVSAIKGGKNDMVLFLNQGDLSIPVSKSYREEIRHSLAVQGA